MYGKDNSEIIEQSYNSTHQNSDAFSALQYRLDTSQTLEAIELFLKGYAIEVRRDPESNRYFQVHVPLDKKNPNKFALANKEGRQAILNIITTQFNPQAIQGNTTDVSYIEHLVRFHVNFSCDIIENCYTWDIPDNKLNFLIDFIMAVIEMPLTRTLDNKERESYTQTLRTVESSTIHEPRKEGMFNRA